MVLKKGAFEFSMDKIKWIASSIGKSIVTKEKIFILKDFQMNTFIVERIQMKLVYVIANNLTM